MYKHLCEAKNFWYSDDVISMLLVYDKLSEQEIMKNVYGVRENMLFGMVGRCLVLLVCKM
jgi:hypothetical protein